MSKIEPSAEKEATPKPKKKSRKSFICSILGSVKEPVAHEEMDVIQEQSEHNNDDGLSGEPTGVKVIRPVIGAANSAFVRVQSNSANSDALVSDSVVAQAEKAPTEDRQDKVADGKGHANGKDMEPLNVHMDDAMVVVQGIVQLFRNYFKLLKDHEIEVHKEM